MSEKVILMIMDGWGIGDASDKSAVYKAKTPFYDNALNQFPNSNYQLLERMLDYHLAKWVIQRLGI